MMKLYGFIFGIALAGMTFASMATPVQAQGTSTQVTWEVEGSVLYIGGTGVMADFGEAENQPWYGYKSTVRSVVIAEGVTSIGDNAFADYTKISSVTIADSVKSIGEYAFKGTALDEVTIPEDVEVVEKGAFAHCNYLYDMTFNGSFTVIEGGISTIPAYTNMSVYEGSYAYRYARDYSLNYYSLGQGLVIDVAGFQISSKVKGVRTMYSTNIPKQEVSEVGLVYGMSYKGDDERVDYPYTSLEDMFYGDDNYFVHSYPATSEGTSSKIYSDFEDSRSYVMTMTFGKPTAAYYKANYYVRAYAKLSSGRIVYSRVYHYSVYDIAEELYSMHMMNREEDHNFLYEVLSTVNPDCPQTDWTWDQSFDQGDEPPLTETKVTIKGFQISTSANGVRTLFISNGDEKIESVGMIYGLPSQINNPEDEMIVGSTNSGIQSYEASENAKVENCNINEGSLYTMTMKYDVGSSCSYKQEYYARAYAKMTDGTYSYSEINKYSPYSIAERLYQFNSMYSLADHNYLYEHILKVVDPNYEPVDYYWSYMLIPGKEYWAGSDENTYN